MMNILSYEVSTERGHGHRDHRGDQVLVEFVRSGPKPAASTSPSSAPSVDRENGPPRPGAGGPSMLHVRQRPADERPRVSSRCGRSWAR